VLVATFECSSSFFLSFVAPSHNLNRLLRLFPLLSQIASQHISPHQAFVRRSFVAMSDQGPDPWEDEDIHDDSGNGDDDVDEENRDEQDDDDELNPMGAFASFPPHPPALS